MSSYKAVIFSEFDISKISFGKPKKHNQGSVINIRYNDRPNFVLQTPLMNTFGISQYNDKWSLGLSFNYSNGLSEEDLARFQKVIEEIEEKISTELANGLYKEWLSVGDKWDKFSPELKMQIISEKYNKSLLRHSKKDVEKRYAPTMNVKLNRKKDSMDFNVETYMMDCDNRFICNEKGELVEFDIKEHLYFEESEERKLKPRVYCLFSMSIWIINQNIFVTPVCNQVLIQPVKSLSQRVTFNERGFMSGEEKLCNENEYEENMDDANEQRPAKRSAFQLSNTYDDDNDMPARAY